MDFNFRTDFKDLYKPDDRFYAKYEPIVSSTLDVFSHEILFRLNNKDNSHIAYLEKLRNIDKTFFVFCMICRRAFEDQLFTWNQININLDLQDLLNPNFFTFLDWLHSEILIDPTKINFEILENYEINEDNMFHIVSRINSLSRRGFNISIDDLFSWYSSKQRIDFLLWKKVNLSMVKIDWKFLQKLYLGYKYGYRFTNQSKDLPDFRDLENYISEWKSSGIIIVWEWIETDEMLDFVKKLWIEYFQWYLFQNFKSEKIYRLEI